MKKSQFKIEQKLNESGTTIVYKAFDEVLHRNVLLKVLHKHLANDVDLRERFVREARACAALQSEHIVQVYDLTEIDGAPAIVMEFIEGHSLKEVIASGASKNLEFAKKAAVHILRGLSIAHERGIIHRDIKPGNILVSDQSILKVTDFGLAYVALSTTVTMEGMVLGTPAYMAPEQVRGDEIDSRTDLFALGLTLVEILSGERIFEGSTYSECMKKVLAFKVDELKRFESISDPEFDSFLEKLLHPEKEMRFPSAREALKSIGDKKYSNDVRPVSASPKKRSFIIGIAAVALVAIVVFGWISVSRQSLPEVATEYQQPQSITADPMTVKKEQIEDRPVEAVKKQSPAAIMEKSDEKNIVAVSKDSGKVYLTSTPWAKVYVNNQLIGETPIARPVTLAAGSHTVMFTNPSFDPIVKTITMESNREITVTGNFLEQAGYLQCNVTPWAEVFVDEQYKDTTPLSKPLMVSAGRHSLRFRNSAFPDIVKDIIVKAKDTTQLTISFHK